MIDLEELENQSIYIFREAYSRFRNIGLLWSIGKDSTAMLWIARKAFFGHIPFPVIHIDTSYKFPEIYEFRDKYVKEWNLNLLVSQNKTALADGMSPEKEKFRCCHALKTEALKQTLQEKKFEALFLA
ncbi:MAG TPA: phosphoadenosine phosphosulfate reductase family protein, partial [Planctomycetota bacterium]|nr:phosphoadenosine phosphosulfate reductase family protein [Planctomycetota bacterium]